MSDFWQPPQPRGDRQPLPALAVFFGNRGDFFRLVRRGAGLELITFGFYRFWLATDIRHHLWSNTFVDGDAAEYTGRGKELLLGFLFALAILGPIYVIYFLIGIEAERYKSFASFPLVLFFFLFGQFAIFRARRYRLTRTVWRGVRFWMDGSGLTYAWRAFLWGLFAAITLGLSIPWRLAALERYKMQHTYYGDLRGDFKGRGLELFKQVWYLLLLAPVALVLFPLAPFVYARFKAKEWRWWLSGIRLGRVRLETNLPDNALYGLYWKVIGWYLLLIVIFGIYSALCGFAVAVSTGVIVANGAWWTSTPLLVLMVIGYLALILSLTVVIRMYLVRDLWMKMLASVSVHGIDALADVAAKGELAGALGEGLADGLDVAGF